MSQPFSFHQEMRGVDETKLAKDSSSSFLWAHIQVHSLPTLSQGDATEQFFSRQPK